MPKPKPGAREEGRQRNKRALREGWKTDRKDRLATNAPKPVQRLGCCAKNRRGKRDPTGNRGRERESPARNPVPHRNGRQKGRSTDTPPHRRAATNENRRCERPSRAKGTKRLGFRPSPRQQFDCFETVSRLSRSANQNNPFANGKLFNNLFL